MKSKIISLANIVVCILLVFVLIGTFGMFMADKIYTANYFIFQAIRTDTYESAYNSLMQDFSDSYDTTNIPIEVYEKAFTRDWMTNAIEETIHSTFEDREANIDFADAEKTITEYFEEYARKSHVIKDDVYAQKLEESLSYAEKVAADKADVYSLNVLKQAGITDKISAHVDFARKYRNLILAISVILMIVLKFLKNPIYWIGTSFFSSGMIMTIPTAIIKLSGSISKLSLKDGTAYTLITGILNSWTNTVLIAGVIMLLFGVVFIAVQLIAGRK